MTLKSRTTFLQSRAYFRSSKELQHNLLREIEASEHRAHQCGMLVTARAPNRAKMRLAGK